MARAPVADRFRHNLDAVAGMETLTAEKTFGHDPGDSDTHAVERYRRQTTKISYDSATDTLTVMLRDEPASRRAAQVVSATTYRCFTARPILHKR